MQDFNLLVDLRSIYNDRLKPAALVGFELLLGVLQILFRFPGIVCLSKTFPSYKVLVTVFCLNAHQTVPHKPIYILFRQR